MGWLGLHSRLKRDSLERYGEEMTGVRASWSEALKNHGFLIDPATRYCVTSAIGYFFQHMKDISIPSEQKFAVMRSGESRPCRPRLVEMWNSCELQRFSNMFAGTVSHLLAFSFPTHLFWFCVQRTTTMLQKLLRHLTDKYWRSYCRGTRLREHFYNLVLLRGAPISTYNLLLILC
jgi:hypothetical protein